VSGTRLLVGLAWAFALVELPLALSAPTGLLVVPAYALLCLVVAAGAAVDAFGGRPARCGAWGGQGLLTGCQVRTGQRAGPRSGRVGRLPLRGTGPPLGSRMRAPSFGPAFGRPPVALTRV
jgi:hypothetical protein